MSTKTSDSRRAKSKNVSTPNISEADHEKVLAERNELKDQVARKNEEIEKLRTALVSAREYLSKAFECLQDTNSTAKGHKTESPKTPKEAKVTRKFGSDGVLKRSASNFGGHNSARYPRPLKRSFMSAPEGRPYEDS